MPILGISKMCSVFCCAFNTIRDMINFVQISTILVFIFINLKSKRLNVPKKFKDQRQSLQFKAVESKLLW